MDFLDRYPDDELVLGPIQKSEAIAIYGLIRCIRPQKIVEIGFGQGDSTEALLAGIHGIPGATVTSYDIRVSTEHASLMMGKHPNLSVFEADQTELILDDDVDFLFLDASHDFEMNRTFWLTNSHKFPDHAFIVVHDTGLWADDFIDDPTVAEFGVRGSNRGVTGRFHQPGEVEFVKWVQSLGTWNRVDIFSKNCFRHGFTILQRSSPTSQRCL